MTNYRPHIRIMPKKDSLFFGLNDHFIVVGKASPETIERNRLDGDNWYWIGYSVPPHIGQYGQYTVIDFYNTVWEWHEPKEAPMGGKCMAKIQGVPKESVDVRSVWLHPQADRMVIIYTRHKFVKI